MTKTRRVLLAVLTLALVVSLAACNILHLPETATGSIDDNTPTDDPTPADPIVGEWKLVPDDENDDDILELVLEKSGQGFSKSRGELYVFAWTRSEELLIVNDEEGEFKIKILELTDDKLVLLPGEDGEYDENDKMTLARKAPRDPGDMSKDKLLGKWKMDYDNNHISIQFNADGYGEMITDWDGLCIFHWKLTGDELRVFIEGSVDDAFYYYVSVKGDKLTMDNEYDEPDVLTRDAKGARAVANVNKDDLVGKWESSLISLQFNADGTGIVNDSDCLWSIHGDMVTIIFDSDMYSYAFFIAELNGDSLSLDDKYEEPFYFTRSK